MEEIHNNLLNGKRKEMISLIDSYGNYDFWADYYNYLCDLYVDDYSILKYFKDATISYFRIKNR